MKHGCRPEPLVSFIHTGSREALAQLVSTTHSCNFCMSTKQQDFCHKRRKRDCVVTVQLVRRGSVKNLCIDILNKWGQVMLKNTISLYGCSEMKWAEMTADSFQLLALLQL